MQHRKRRSPVAASARRVGVAGTIPLALAVFAAGVGAAAPSQPGITTPSPQQPGVVTPTPPAPQVYDGPVSAIPDPPSLPTRPKPQYRPQPQPQPQSQLQGPSTPEVVYEPEAPRTAPPAPIEAPQGKLRFGEFETDIPQGVSPEAAEKANAWAAYAEREIAAAYDRAGYLPEESDRIAATTIAGAILGGVGGAAAVGIPAAIVGGVVGGAVGAGVGAVVGTSVLGPGPQGTGVGALIGLGVGAGVGAAGLGLPAALFGGIVGALGGGAIGNALGNGKADEGPAAPPPLFELPALPAGPSLPVLPALPVVTTDSDIQDGHVGVAVNGAEVVGADVDATNGTATIEINGGVVGNSNAHIETTGLTTDVSTAAAEPRTVSGEGEWRSPDNAVTVSASGTGTISNFGIEVPTGQIKVTTPFGEQTVSLPG